MPVRVRIAPSPTGDPHVGTAYIALFNYCFAKKHRGKFVLRIEDTDRTRSSKESEHEILGALRWLGLAWDEGPDVGGSFGPYRQSERAGLYKEHADRLLSSGRAYRCFCTTERLAELRDSQRREKRPPGYDGKCRALDASEVDKRAQDGEAHTVRLAMPKEGKTKFVDKLRGELEFDNQQIDDQVLLKSDGFPTYHLANVVDDHAMEITHVVRAEEWISSTPKHVQLYDAFGWPEPEWIHMPLLRNKDKSKISKRKNPVSIAYYRDAGFLPEAMVNFLANMGYSIGDDKEKFLIDEMVKNFDFERVSLGGPVFDLEKLGWLNGLYLRELSTKQLVERIKDWRFRDEQLLRVAALVHERMRRLDEFGPLTTFFFSGDLDYEPVREKLVPKKRTAVELRKVLAALAEEYEKIGDRFSAATLEPVTREFADAKEWKTKELFMPLRIVVTGQTASPPLFETMEVLGRELCRRRMATAIEYLKRQK